MGSVGRRLGILEQLVEGSVEAIFDRLERHLPLEELRRVLEILADEEESGRES